MDQGHEKLIADLKELLQEAEGFEFHDFKNEKHPAPKIALYQHLLSLAQRVKDGMYDN